MQKIKIAIVLNLLLFLFIGHANASSLSDNLKGKILLQVEDKGQAWYVNPQTGKRAYLGRPADAFNIMRELGLGVTNKDLEKIAIKGEDHKDLNFAKKLAGKILLQVEENGEAWYVYPKDYKRYYLGRPADAFKLMRELGLGISNENLNQIKISEKYKEKYYSKDGRELFKVVKVIDGDTITIEINGKKETLRLIGIDTPETVHPTKPVECMGAEASNRAKELLTGKMVSVEADSSQGERDKYNRLLRYVILEDGRNFNRLMIEEGFANEYKYSVPYKYQTEFKEAQNNAKLKKVGLWADGVCDNYSNNDKQEEEVKILTDCDCSFNKYNCSDFKTHAEAQALFLCCGGVNNDIHRLDMDGNGDACESLP